MYYRRRNSWLTFKLVIASAVVASIGLILIAMPQLIRSIVVVATYPIVHVRNLAVTAVQPFFQIGAAEKDAVIADLRAELEAQRMKGELESVDARIAQLETDEVTASSTDSDPGTSTEVVLNEPVNDDVVSADDDRFALLGEAVFAPPYSITDRLVVRLSPSDTPSREVGQRVYARVDGLYLPLGTIESSDGVTAATLLYSFPERPVLVRFGDAAPVHTLSGYGGGVLVGQIPKALTIEAGEKVSLVQDGEMVFLGIVRHVERDDSNPLDRIFVSLPLAPTSLSSIYVERF